MCLFSDRSQTTSKHGKNKTATQEAVALFPSILCGISNSISGEGKDISGTMEYNLTPIWLSWKCFKCEWHDLFFNTQDNLKETEEKYRKAMVSIAQLDNEKQALLYQVDCLKDR